MLDAQGVASAQAQSSLKESSLYRTKHEQNHRTNCHQKVYRALGHGESPSPLSASRAHTEEIPLDKTIPSTVVLVEGAGKRSVAPARK
jgi:hypothetical protein